MQSDTLRASHKEAKPVSNTQLTVKHEEYTWPLKVLNGVAGIAETMGLPIGRCEVQSILDSVRRATGHQDWGDDAFIQPLELLCDTVQRAGFTPLARIVMRQSFTRAVSNRLELQAIIARHPEIRERRIERPVFVLGFPRTGTTVLQNLLCLHPERRGLQFWELVTPVPSADDPVKDRASRLRNARMMLKAAYLIAPDQEHVHRIGPETYEECWPLFCNTFCVMNYDLQSGLAGYGKYLYERDMVGPYREYKEFLQLNAWRNDTTNLVLKCPEHLWFLDALLEVFPDACIVWTHRDPLPTIASYCSLISVQWRTLYGKIDPRIIGAHISTRFLEGTQRAMAARAKADPKRFFDVNFHNLVQDQAGTVREICSYFDLPYRDGMDAQVAAWLESDRDDHKDAHKYSIQRYGLDAEDIHARYADYIQMFDVKVKGAA